MSQSGRERDVVFTVPSTEELAKAVAIRGRIPIESTVFRQMERTNIALSNPDPSVYEANVRALLYLLPSQKRMEVEGRAGEFNRRETSLEYKTWCGQNVGTVENPFIDEDTGEILSPIVSEMEVTDYETLHKIIVVAFEDLGLTWKTEKSGREVGEVIDAIVPKSVIKRAEEELVNVITDAREKFPDLTFQMLVNRLKESSPATPSFDREREPE